jgi:hypothetical protein
MLEPIADAIRGVGTRTRSIVGSPTIERVRGLEADGISGRHKTKQTEKHAVPIVDRPYADATAPGRTPR